MTDRPDRGRSVAAGLAGGVRPTLRLRLAAGVVAVAAGLAVGGPPAGAVPPDLVFLDSCSSSGPCAQLTAPVPSVVAIGAALTATDQTAVLIYGQGSAVATQIVDGSPAGLPAAVGALAGVQTGASGFATVHVDNTTGPTVLTTAVPISAVGTTAMAGVVVRSGSGAIVIDNRGPVSVVSSDGSGVVGQSTGGSVSVFNGGDVAISGDRSGGLVARGPTGALTIENDGRVTVEGSRGSGLAADAGGGDAVIRVVNRGAVRIVGDADAGAGAFQTSATATAINEGTIDVLGSHSVGLASSVFGSGAAATINRGVVTVSGGVASAGLDATSIAGWSTLINSGTVDVRADGGTGAMVRSDGGSVGVRNEGRIAFTGTTGAAVTVLTSGGAIDVVNAGTLSTLGERTTGLAVTTASGAVTIDNRGAVTARGAESAGLVAVGGVGETALVNSGRISADGDRSVGVSFAAGGVVRIANSGLIAASGQDAVALRSSGTGGSELTNVGTIGGSVRLGSGADVVANFGAIVGDVDLGDGDDVYGTAIGASAGRVAGGNGRDTLVQLGGVGQSGQIDGAVMTGFERALLLGPAGWRLSGDLSTTAVTVDGGGFVEMAGRVGDMMVGPGSMLGGSGRTGAVSAAGAVLAPGDGLAGTGVGTLRVAGDLTLDGASRVLIDLRGATSDRIAVDGRARLGGAMLTLRGAGLIGGTSFDVVTAGGGVVGTFASQVTWTDAGWDFLDVRVGYGATGVTVTVVDPVSTAVKSSLPSDATFVTAVFDSKAATDATKIAAYQQLGAMIDAAAGNPAVVRRVFDEVGGKATAEAIAAGSQALRTVDQAVSRATDAVLGGGVAEGGGVARGMAMGYVDDRPATPAGRAIAGITGSTAALPRMAPSLIAWSTGQYGFGSATSGATSSDFRSGGLTVGLIRRFDEAFSLGLAGGWTRSEVTVADPGADLRVDSWHLLAHGTWDAPRFRIDGTVGHAVQSYQSQRSVGAGRASAAYDGGAFRAGFDAGWKTVLGDTQIMPHAGVDLIHARTGGYSESGAGPFALSVAENATTTLDGKVGVKWSMRRKLAGGTTLAPQVDLAWVHGWGNATPTVHAAMLGSSFVITGASRARDAAAVAAGLTAEFANGLSLSGRYAGRLASDLRAHDFSAGLAYRW